MIYRASWWDGADEALAALRDQYRRDRTEGQDVSIFLAVEKAGMVVQLESWFGHLGVPVVALAGYSSQTLVRSVVDDAERQQRPGVLIYAGDFDPSGEDILRDWEARTNCWSAVERVALSADQVGEYKLPTAPGKAGDSRAAAFTSRHGQLVQVELDALNPAVLRDLYDGALVGYWDVSSYAASIEREESDRAYL